MSRSDLDDSEEIVAPTGRFRLYMGMAAGVGKTVAMLDEGWRRHERGADVVVGLVETHDRKYTEEQIRGLEVVPRKVVEYRGSTFTEMDLDAVLARHPEVALIDELAHTNVPGSGRNEKRWQDVLELLGAGIAVISTVNVQHLESIADAVEEITNIPIRERVPDAVVRKADQIELIDSSPEQLRRRMLHGNVYPQDKVAAALNSFFRTENLTALRELALRFVADETEEELLEFLSRHATPHAWETQERIVVGVDDAPGTEAVLRRAARFTTRVKGDLHVVHVQNDRRTAPQDAKAIENLRRLAEDVGGSWHELVGDDPAEVLVDFAGRNQITQICVGASRHVRLFARGSMVSRLLRLAGPAGLDVHIIARHEREPVADDRDGRST